MSQVRKQNPISERDFLYLCKEAVDLVKLEWQDRDIIASKITTIWLHHSKELPDRSRQLGDCLLTLTCQMNMSLQKIKAFMLPLCIRYGYSNTAKR